MIFLLCMQIVLVALEVKAHLYIEDFNGFTSSLILQQIPDMSRIQCTHRCNRNNSCKNIAYEETTKMCKLLRSENTRKPNKTEDLTQEEISKNRIFSLTRLPGSCY